MHCSVATFEFLFYLVFFYFGRVFPCALRIRLKTRLASCEDGLKSGTYVQTGSPNALLDLDVYQAGKAREDF